MKHKLTTAEFKQRLEEKRPGEIELLSEYKGATKPIKIRFKECGHKKVVNRPYNLLCGMNCSICNNKKRRLSDSEYKKRVYDLVGDEYTVASKYVNARTKVNIVHNKCGYKDWWVRPQSFLDGDRCPMCSRSTPKTTEQFKREVKEKFGDEYTVLGEYKDRKTPIKIRHNVCGHTWNPTPGNLLGDRSHCKYCSRKKSEGLRSLTPQQVVLRITNLFNGTIILDNPNEYRNGDSYLSYHCTVCDSSNSAMAKNLLQGHGCPTCANKHRNDGTRLTINELKRRIKEKSNGAYEYVSGKYENSSSPIVLKHLDCGHTYTTNWLKFSQGASTCKHCRGSFGEQQVKGYLDLHKIKYEYGYIIPDLKDKRNLHFDFWIKKYNVAIEYDGIQHYKKTQFNHKGSAYAKEQYKLTVKHDDMKNKYALDRHIILIRIPYFKDVNTVLNKSLFPLIKLQEHKIKPTFKSVSSSTVALLMTDYHYLHRRVPVKYAYGLYVGKNLMGMITYTVPNKTTVSKALKDNATINNTLELSRLYIKDEVSQTIPNITSQFVSWSLRQLKKLGNWYIISFADSGMHHVGAIYQATNFLYCGLSKPTGEFAWGGLNKQRERWEKGKYYRYLIKPTTKYRYIKFVGSKGFKKHARRELKLKIQPYPKADNVHYSVGDTEDRLIKDRETGKIWKEKDLVKELNK